MNPIKYALEDLHEGLEIDLGTYDVTAEEIISFAKQFDPAPFHLDEVAGQASLLGGLAASGWHVCSIAMRMMCDHFFLKATSQGAPGIDECKWLAPVLAGERLSGTLHILSARLSASRPGFGVAVLRTELRNRKGEAVLMQTNACMFKSRVAP
jgi:acyl dehydratase